jgi:hypothetical protein
LWGARSPSTGTLFDVEKAWRPEGIDLSFRSIDTGHFMPEEDPEQTQAILLEFFKGAAAA